MKPSVRPFTALALAQQQLDTLDATLLRRRLKQTQSPCDIEVTVAGRLLKAFCSNDYPVSYTHLTLPTNREV